MVKTSSLTKIKKRLSIYAMCIVLSLEAAHLHNLNLVSLFEARRTWSHCTDTDTPSEFVNLIAHLVADKNSPISYEDASVISAMLESLYPYLDEDDKKQIIANAARLDTGSDITKILNKQGDIYSQLLKRQLTNYLNGTLGNDTDVAFSFLLSLVDNSLVYHDIVDGTMTKRLSKALNITTDDVEEIMAEITKPDFSFALDFPQFFAPYLVKRLEKDSHRDYEKYLLASNFFGGPFSYSPANNIFNSSLELIYNNEYAVYIDPNFFNHDETDQVYKTQLEDLFNDNVVKNGTNSELVFNPLSKENRFIYYLLFCRLFEVPIYYYTDIDELTSSIYYDMCYPKVNEAISLEDLAKFLYNGQFAINDLLEWLLNSSYNYERFLDINAYIKYLARFYTCLQYDPEADEELVRAIYNKFMQPLLEENAELYDEYRDDTISLQKKYDNYQVFPVENN